MLKTKDSADTSSGHLKAAAPSTNPYSSLGVRTFINCDGVRTSHGGSIMLPEVSAAMEAASSHFVNMDELMEAAGRRLAELTGAEWGIVTCGSSAAMSLAAAACVAGNDPVRMLRLPFTDGWINRVIIPRSQRFAYEQAIRMVGTHIIEISTVEDLERALSEPAALIVVLGTHEEASSVRLDEIVAMARPRGIPILVDAASEHIARPSPWLTRGADMVVYSGGKYLRGPQTSGFLLGRKDLVEAAWRNASPHQAFGRPMKVSKECVIGALTALQYWFERRDGKAEERRWHSDLKAIAGYVEGVAGVTTEIISGTDVQPVPRLRISWDRLRVGLHGEILRQNLLGEEPRIMLKDRTVTANSLEIDPFSLQSGEAIIVGKTIAAALAKPVKSCRVLPTISPDISGEWYVSVTFLRGHRMHRLWLEQNRAIIKGRQESEQFEGDVRGELDNGKILLVFRMRYEGIVISYQLKGEVSNGQMSGIVILGSCVEQSEGPINLSQFGTGRWCAIRVAKWRGAQASTGNGRPKRRPARRNQKRSR